MKEHRGLVSFHAGDHSHRVVHRRSSSESDGEKSMSTCRMKSSCSSWTFAVVFPVLESIRGMDLNQHRVGEVGRMSTNRERKVDSPSNSLDGEPKASPAPRT